MCKTCVYGFMSGSLLTASPHEKPNSTAGMDNSLTSRHVCRLSLTRCTAVRTSQSGPVEGALVADAAPHNPPPLRPSEKTPHRDGGRREAGASLAATRLHSVCSLHTCFFYFFLFVFFLQTASSWAAGLFWTVSRKDGAGRGGGLFG